jgi:hypothetical protein
VEQAHEQSTDGGSGIRRRRVVVLRAGVDESQLALASQPEVARGAARADLGAQRG